MNELVLGSYLCVACLESDKRHQTNRYPLGTHPVPWMAGKPRIGGISMGGEHLAFPTKRIRCPVHGSVHVHHYGGLPVDNRENGRPDD